MTPDDLEQALQRAFAECERANAALTPAQQEILRRMLSDRPIAENPLAALTPAERTALLQFIRDQTTQRQSWKITLWNDWLQGRDSGTVQFIRDRYGIQWLDQIQPRHLAAYGEPEHDPAVRLQVGDRIQVCNALWEWVPPDQPAAREWFPCVVIQVPAESESESEGDRHARCTVRFASGAEYEIQGIYEWNRPNWRWSEDPI